MRVSIIVDGQIVTYLNNYTGWRIDWGKLKNFYKCAFGELHKAYYCSGGIRKNMSENTQTRIKGFLNHLQDVGWVVPDQYTRRKSNDSLNVDATVGFYLAECLEYTDVLILFANDGDYFQSLIPYLKNGKPIFCVGDPDKISNNLKDIATVIDIKELRQFIAETEMED